MTWLVVLVLTGCGSAGRTLSQRELVVVFTPEHTAADVERVREACDGVGGAKAVTASRNTAAARRYPLRFDVSRVDLRGRSHLTICLSKDPSVRGYLDSESTSGS